VSTLGDRALHNVRTSTCRRRVKVRCISTPVLPKPASSTPDDNFLGNVADLRKRSVPPTVPPRDDQFPVTVRGQSRGHVRLRKPHPALDRLDDAARRRRAGPRLRRHRFANLGIPVFPCVPGGKQPLTPNGFHDATSAARIIHAWWQRTPDANIGLPTGASTGILVVDIDVHPGGNGFAAFERARAEGLAGVAMLRNASDVPVTNVRVDFTVILAHADGLADAETRYLGGEDLAVLPPSTEPREVRWSIAPTAVMIPGVPTLGDGQDDPTTAPMTRRV